MDTAGGSPANLACRPDQSGCVTRATDDYLISGNLPAEGTHRAAVEPGSAEARIAGPKAPAPIGF